VRQRRLRLPALFAAELQWLLPRRHLCPLRAAELEPLRLQRRDLRHLRAQQHLHAGRVHDVDVLPGDLLGLLLERAVRAAVDAERGPVWTERSQLRRLPTELDVSERHLRRDGLFARELQRLL